MNVRALVLFAVLVGLSGLLVWLVRADSARDAEAEKEPPFDKLDLAREWQPLPDDLKPAAADEVQARTGVEILAAVANFTAPGVAITGTAPSRDEIRSTALLIVNELQRYPADYLRASRINMVVLTGILRAKGRDWGGLASPGNGSLLMSARSDFEFRTHVFHHELFHLFDRKLFDLGGWTALNPPGAEYDRKEALVLDPASGAHIDHTLYAFISRYAMASAYEDRAELFAWLLTDRRTVLDLAAKDRVLRAKLDWLRRDVAARAPDMDDAMWSRQ
jgi:hypothetical protein